MLARERQIYILQKLQMQPAITASQLAEELSCSRSTIQRDLRDLDRRGEVQRHFGGVMRSQVETIMSSLNEPGLDTTMDRNAAAKRLIAARALTEINDGDLVFIDSGSTPLYLLPGLAERRVIVVTNNFAAVTRLAGVHAEVYLLGGRYEHRYQATMDAITVREIQDFRFDIAVFGANGVDLKFGEAYVSEYQIGEIKRNVLARSKKSILLVDDTKFDYTGVCRYASLDDFDKVFVNKTIDGIPVPENFVVCEEDEKGNREHN
jgi:DeoR family fructose operon transcriptional repressor